MVLAEVIVNLFQERFLECVAAQARGAAQRLPLFIVTLGAPSGFHALLERRATGRDVLAAAVRAAPFLFLRVEVVDRVNVGAGDYTSLNALNYFGL